MSSPITVSERPVQTSVYFLERSSRWQKEKPFLLDYTPVPPAIKSNAAVNQEEVTIDDIRGNEANFTFANNGFFILPLECDMKAEDYDDDVKIQNIYLRHVAESVKQELKASRVQIYDYTVRKRNSKFPVSTGEHYSHKQPSSVAHVDTTPSCMEQMLRTMNKKNGEELQRKRHQSVNIWKPLRGPIHDWPLALCDPRSLDRKDLQPRDTVKRESFIETYQVHHLSSHKWYYLSGQMPTEAWVFLQADSSPNGMLGVPHTSFFNPFATPGDVLRESIEVRCLVFYDDDEKSSDSS